MALGTHLAASLAFHTCICFVTSPRSKNRLPYSLYEQYPRTSYNVCDELTKFSFYLFYFFIILFFLIIIIIIYFFNIMTITFGLCSGTLAPHFVPFIVYRWLS